MREISRGILCVNVFLWVFLVAFYKLLSFGGNQGSLNRRRFRRNCFLNYLFRKQSVLSLSIINAINLPPVRWRAPCKLVPGNSYFGWFSNPSFPFPFQNKTHEKYPSNSFAGSFSAREHSACTGGGGGRWGPAGAGGGEPRTPSWHPKAAAPRFPSNSLGNEFNMCGKEGLELVVL